MDEKGHLESKTSESTNNIALSIIIPTYNRSEIVLSCVENILKSNMEVIELVVSDNGSFDDTVQTLLRIEDPRLKILRLDENTGAWNLLYAARYTSGRIVTWISDEDDLNVEMIPEIVAEFDDDKIDVLAYSTIFGVDRSAIRFENKIYESRSDSLHFLLSFSGCGGIFVRGDNLRKGLAMRKISPRDAYAFWNFYPVGFLAALSHFRMLRTSNKIVCEQNRQGMTTSEWYPQSKSVLPQRHFYPRNISDKGQSMMRFIWADKDLSHGEKLKSTLRIVKNVNQDLQRLRSQDFLNLLRAHYNDKIVSDFEAEVLTGWSFWTIGRGKYLLRVIFYSLVGRFKPQDESLR